MRGGRENRLLCTCPAPDHIQMHRLDAVLVDRFFPSCFVARRKRERTRTRARVREGAREKEKEKEKEERKVKIREKKKGKAKGKEKRKEREQERERESVPSFTTHHTHAPHHTPDNRP